jgi:hypothetical protein
MFKLDKKYANILDYLDEEDREMIIEEVENMTDIYENVSRNMEEFSLIFYLTTKADKSILNETFAENSCNRGLVETLFFILEKRDFDLFLNKLVLFDDDFVFFKNIYYGEKTDFGKFLEVYDNACGKEKSLKRYIYRAFFSTLNKFLKLSKQNKDFWKLEERLVFGLLKKLLTDSNYFEKDVFEHKATVSSLYQFIFRYISEHYMTTDYISKKEPAKRIKELRKKIKKYLDFEEREKLTELSFLTLPVFSEMLFWGESIADGDVLESVLEKEHLGFLLKTLLYIMQEV